MRLIDADALLPQLKRSREKNPYTGAMLGSLNAVYDFTHRDVLNLINYAPTIDAEPVRHGTWRVVNVPKKWGGATLRCSECNTGGTKSWNYCPNCGAKMDEEVQG